VGLVGANSERFRKVTMSADDLLRLTVLDPKHLFNGECFDEFEREHKLPSVTARSRLDAARRDLEMGDALRARLTRSPC
jgi:hypothetical protein